MPVALMCGVAVIVLSVAGFVMELLKLVFLPLCLVLQTLYFPLFKPNGVDKARKRLGEFDKENAQ
jgi:hypothetical protein